MNSSKSKDNNSAESNSTKQHLELTCITVTLQYVTKSLCQDCSLTGQVPGEGYFRIFLEASYSSLKHRTTLLWLCHTPKDHGLNTLEHEFHNFCRDFSFHYYYALYLVV